MARNTALDARRAERIAPSRQHLGICRRPDSRIAPAVGDFIGYERTV
jgi:hypothetical protein